MLALCKVVKKDIINNIKHISYYFWGKRGEAVFTHINQYELAIYERTFLFPCCICFKVRDKGKTKNVDFILIKKSNKKMCCRNMFGQSII